MYTKLNGFTAKPELWSCYTADLLWTDAHIAKQMLTYHLNPEVNAASRTFAFIDKSADWLIEEFNLNSNSKVIDFGCGPGLYTQRLKQRGVGTVVGVDFSENSISYAKQQAQALALDIDYRLANYLEYEDEEKYDLITLVMCDYGALNPAQRSVLLDKFKSMLKPDGVIALDVLTETRFQGLSESISLEKNHMGNFWSAGDYWCIQSSYGYPSDLVWLDKYVVIEEQKEWTVFNWFQHFSADMLASEISSHGLKVTDVYQDLCGTPFAEADELAVVIKHA